MSEISRQQIEFRSILAIIYMDERYKLIEMRISISISYGMNLL